MANRYVEKLRRFAPLEDEHVLALETVTGAGQLMGPRRDLIREGDQAAFTLVMLEGWACRYKVLPNGSRQITEFLLPGDGCDLGSGASAEMDGSAQTLTDAKVAKIGAATMSALMIAHPLIAQAVYAARLCDEATLRAWIISLGRRSSTERAAHLLLELYARTVRSGLAVHGVVELPLSQAVLADALGMTPVHVNRVLQDLRRADAIEIRRGSLRFQNLGALTQISGFDGGYLLRRLRAPGGS